ncbi:polysaccharide biosynthesis tyrosine autokinase [Flavobacteriaceae bacterium]|nr:polysaccharide biosynthesis tyrosine autokinase [Flavobacteriaceae bacterium]
MEHLNQNSFTFSENDPIDFKKKLGRYLNYWPWFLVTVFITLTSTYFYLRYAPRIYESTAKIKVLDEQEGLSLPTEGVFLNRSSINLTNEIEILKSYIVLEKVAKRLNLTTNFYEVGTIQTRQLHVLPFYFEESILQNKQIDKSLSFTIEVSKSTFEVINNKTQEVLSIPNHDSFAMDHDLPFNIDIRDVFDFKDVENKTYLVNIKPIKNMVASLKGSIKISPVGDGSDLLKLNTKGESIERSEAIINTLIEVFNEDGITDRQLVSERTMSFIDERFVFLAEELDSIEINYQGFKEDNNLVDIVSDVSSGIEQRTQAETEVFKLENQIELVVLLRDNLNDSPEMDLLPANIGVNSENINQLISNFNTAVIDRDKLLTSGGENNPAVQLASSALIELKLNLQRSLQNYLTQLKTSKGQLEDRLLDFTGKISELPKQQRLLKGIVRQQQIKESLYLLLLQKREEAAINLAITEPSIKVVEYALTSANPISPQVNIIYTGALLAGLLLPFGFLYLMFMLDTKVHTRDDIEKVTTNIPILAEIPEIKKKGSLLFTNPNATSVLAESFRILSANVDYLLPKNDDNSKGKIIFSTSTIKGEGKTFVSLNLSLALASLNKKVLLIGADMRNPQIHTYFGTSKNQLGLSSYLNDASENWKELLMTGFDKHPKHYTMLSGAIPPNPAHLLTNGRFEQLLAEARIEFDYIIVDTAPTILVTDTLLISKFADVTLFLTKANYTDKKLLKFSKELSESGKIKNMAYVMNSVGAGKSYSYGYGYGYNYGYSYGYHEEN